MSRPRGPAPSAPPVEHGVGTRPVDASMGLLYEVINHPVESGYAEAAAQPPTAGSTLSRTGRAAAHLAVAVLLGIVTVTAIASLRAPAPAAQESRTLLEQEILDRSQEAEQLQRSNEELSDEIAELQAGTLAGANQALFAEIEEIELLSGASTVRGPGLVLVLDDAEETSTPEEQRDARVLAFDLQVVTNALWAAGAEAIAINGHRLTSLSAIRGVGEAILVDLAPLVAPYRVEAIGDVRSLQTGFARSPAANHMTMLSSTFAIDTSLEAQSELVLDGSSSAQLRHAEVLPGDVASSESPDDEGTT